MAGNNIFLEITAADDNLLKSLQQVDSSLRKIDKSASEVDKEMAHAFGSQPIIAFNKNLNVTSKELGQVSSATDKLNKNLDVSNKNVKTLASTFARVRSSGGAIAAVAGNFANLTGLASLSTVAIDLLGKGFGLLTASISESLKPQDKAIQLSKELTESVIKEQSENDALFNIIRDGTADRDKQDAAIAALNSKYPELIGNIQLETASDAQLLQLQKAINAEVIKGIVNKAKAAQAEKLFNTVVQSQLQLIENQKNAGGISSFLGIDAVAEAALKKNVDKTTNDIKDLKNVFLEVEKNLNGIFGELDLSAASTEIDQVLESASNSSDKLEEKNKKAAEARQKQREKELEEADKFAQEAVRLEREKQAALEQILNELVRTDEEKAIARAEAEARTREESIMKNVDDETKRGELLKANEEKLQEEIGKIQKDSTDANQKAIDEAFKTANDVQFKERSESLQQRSELEAASLREIQQLERNRLIDSGATEKQLTDLEKSQAIERERLALETELKKLQLVEEFGQTRTQVEVETTKKLIAGIQAELAGLGKTANANVKSGKGGLLSSLGLDISSDQLAAIKQGLGQALDIYKQSIQERIDIAQKEVQERDSNLDRLSQQLDEQLKLNQQGFSSNVAGVQKQIAEEEKLRQKALQSQKKAQQEALIIDTVTQSVNLITSASSIFATLSPIPFVGIPLAIGVIAAMFGAFAATKVKAFQAVKLSGGGKIETGYDDRNGGQGNRIENTNLVVGRGEWVVNADTSNKQDDFMRRLNSGIYDNIDIVQAIEAQSKRVTLTHNTYNRVKQENRNAAIERGIEKQTDTLVKAFTSNSNTTVYIYQNGKNTTVKTDKNGSRNISNH